MENNQDFKIELSQFLEHFPLRNHQKNVKELKN